MTYCLTLFTLAVLSFTAPRARADELAEGRAIEAARAHRAGGLKALREADYVAALRELSTAYAIEPATAIDVELGRAYEALGQRNLALQHYERYLDTAPQDRALIEERVGRLRDGVRVDFLPESPATRYRVTTARDSICTTPCAAFLPVGSSKVHVTGDATFDTQISVSSESPISARIGLHSDGRRTAGLVIVGIVGSILATGLTLAAAFYATHNDGAGAAMVFGSTSPGGLLGAGLGLLATGKRSSSVSLEPAGPPDIAEAPPLARFAQRATPHVAIVLAGATDDERRVCDEVLVAAGYIPDAGAPLSVSIDWKGGDGREGSIADRGSRVRTFTIPRWSASRACQYVSSHITELLEERKRKQPTPSDSED